MVFFPRYIDDIMHGVIFFIEMYYSESYHENGRKLIICDLSNIVNWQYVDSDTLSYLIHEIDGNINSVWFVKYLKNLV